MTKNQNPYFISTNPATEEVIERYRGMSREDALEALEKVDHHKATWQGLSPNSRSIYIRKISDLLKKNIERYSSIITKEMGKPISQSEAEVKKCSLLCDYFAAHAESFLAETYEKHDNNSSIISYEPIGTILGIMPWNFPFWQVFRCAIPNLLIGNSFALKHAANVPGCAIELENLFLNSGMPKHTFINLPIEHTNVESIIESNYISGVSFTGSDKAGRIVASICGREVKKCVLELGGSDPYIVLKDADLKLAVEQCITSRIINSGQSCIAAKRLIVDESILSDFIFEAKSQLKNKIPGDPNARYTEIGPLARSDLQENISRQVTESLRLGANCEFKSSVPEKGFFYPLTLLTEVKENHPVFSEETFGPVLAVTSFRNEAEAIRLANCSKYGLGAAVFSKDLSKAKFLAQKCIHSGSVAINDYVRSDPALPFGGVKKSGYGRELSHYGMLEFANIKSMVFKNQ